MKKLHACRCQPGHPLSNKTQPENPGCIVPLCVQDAWVRAREEAAILMAHSDEETVAKFFRAARAVVLTFRPGPEGRPTVDGTRACTFAYWKGLAIALSDNPNAIEIQPPGHIPIWKKYSADTDPHESPDAAKK